MTVQALRLSMSKEFPDYNFDDILGCLNAGNSLDLPIPSQELPNLCCFDDNLLDFDRDGNWASPDGEDECAFAFGSVMKSEGDTRTPLPPSITVAPDSAASPVTSAFNSTEKTDGGSAAQGIIRPPVTTGLPGVATRLRTGAQPPKRLLSSAESMSGSESSSPSSELGDASAIADLPELKFKKGKRKKDVDLDAIDDPQERRKQRRLAKNRATAALSRQRKRDQMATLIARVRAVDAENAKLKEENARLSKEKAQFSYDLGARDMHINRLRGELASLSSGAGGATGSDVSAPAREPAVLTGGDPMLMLSAGEPVAGIDLLESDYEM